MKKWQDLAAPDDPGSWYAAWNMWPTRRGTYETADFSSGTSVAATGSARVGYAFCGKGLTGNREYIVDSAKIWEYSGGSLTDRTGAATTATFEGTMMAQYGDVTIAVLGTGDATVYSTGGNFAALAGAPQANIVCIQSNVVLYFCTNTATDGWAASDVGDYTNYSTGESASGRIIQTPGQIKAAVPYGNDVFVFKPSAIYRMTYVGGVVKWQVQLAWNGIGCNTNGGDQYCAVATKRGVAFMSLKPSSSEWGVYLFDGSSAPILLNPFNELGDCPQPVLCYNPVDDILTIAPGNGSNASGQVTSTGPVYSDSVYYYYSFQHDMWGIGVGSAEEDRESGTGSTYGVLQGDYYARAESSSKPVYWRYRATAGNAFYRCAPVTPTASATCYLQTSKVGSNEFKTTFDRLIPQLRRRTDLGTDSASLEMTLFREREDTSAQTTRTISESSTRKRFDLNGGACSDNFARFKVTWTALDVEVDDFTVKSRPAGTD